MSKYVLILSLFLVGCSSVHYTCPPREKFTGETWADLAYYTSALSVAYDSCAEEKKESVLDWDKITANMAESAAIQKTQLKAHP